jgi:hypothetical protein
MKRLRWLSCFLFGLLLFGCATGGTYPLPLRYEPMKAFPSLQQKFGAKVAFAPFTDERSDTLYIGQYDPLQGTPRFFKSEPAPLGTAVMELLNEALLKKGLKTMSVSNWDGTPESLKNIGADSIFLIHIKKFWVEGKDDFLLRTTIRSSVRLVIQLGVKAEEKVFTRNIDAEREKTVFAGGPDQLKEMINDILTDIFDGLLSNPY